VLNLPDASTKLWLLALDSSSNTIRLPRPPSAAQEKPLVCVFGDGDIRRLPLGIHGQFCYQRICTHILPPRD